MSQNPLNQLETFGQSIWLDYIKRDMVHNGKLQSLITDDGLRGITSNPDIFEKAITGGKDYDAAIKKLVDKGQNVEAIYGALTQEDVRDAADVFRALYDETDGADGYVSLEVNPHLAHDTQGTLEEARRLWKALNRPNVLIKVPATEAGLPAIQQLISEGINVNVTLLFGLDRYREVTDAYLTGLERRVQQQESIASIASVASFFLSRIDVLIDPLLKAYVSQQEAQAELAKKIVGQTAIASAKMAYQLYLEIFHSERFKKLSAAGARTQRLLWASTGTKDPSYSDVKYVEALIGANTVNTLPVETLDAYRDHGKPAARLTTDIAQAAAVFQELPQFDIQINKLTQQLEDEGVEKFNKAYDKLITSLKKNLVKA